MTTTRTDSPSYAVAGTFLEALAAFDLARLRELFAPDARMAALVPMGLQNWDGPDEIVAAYRRWFGDTEQYHLVEADLGDSDPRLYIHYRIRVRAQRLGSEPHLADQHAYLDLDDRGRIAAVRLVCSGFYRDSVDARPAVAP